MSLYSDYHKETFGYETIEVEGGFIVYDLKPPECSIEDFHVRKDLRGGPLAKRLADQVFRRAKEGGALRVWARIRPGLKGAEHALKSDLHYGFKLFGVNGNDIILMKDLGG